MKSHVELLARIFDNVHGELEVLKQKIKWTLNPFHKLLETGHELINRMPFDITCRLCGPDTILAISPKFGVNIVDKLALATHHFPP